MRDVVVPQLRGDYSSVSEVPVEREVGDVIVVVHRIACVEVVRFVLHSGSRGNVSVVQEDDARFRGRYVVHDEVDADVRAPVADRISHGEVHRVVARTAVGVREA